MMSKNNYYVEISRLKFLLIINYDIYVVREYDEPHMSNEMLKK